MTAAYSETRPSTTQSPTDGPATISYSSTFDSTLDGSKMKQGVYSEMSHLLVMFKALRVKTARVLVKRVDAIRMMNRA